MLTHTSGLRQRYAADGILDRNAAQQSLLAASLQSKPGEAFSYANDNYNLLAIILEIQSGVPYEEFLRTEIFAPASMKNSGFWGMPVEEISCVPEVAAPPGQSVSGSNWGFRGATGMRASVHDLFAFVQALQGEAILSNESVDMLMGNHLQLASGTEIGFNWFGERNEDGLYSKSSRGNESFGANAVIYLYPDRDLTIITATNAGPAETGDGPVEGWSRKTMRRWPPFSWKTSSLGLRIGAISERLPNTPEAGPDQALNPLASGVCADFHVGALQSG